MPCHNLAPQSSIEYYALVVFLFRLELNSMTHQFIAFFIQWQHVQYRMPSPAAWIRGSEAARLILEAHVKDTGGYPETVAVMM